jgi:nucleotide-binding universal stress UspA family protein
MKKILVGVDGSPNSTAAMRWALDEARRRSCEVEALLAWHDPLDTSGYGYLGVDISDIEAGSRAQLDGLVDAARALAPDVEVKGVLARGSPSRCLIEAAGDADLVVVGRRGHNAARRLVLGSVSERVVRKSPSTVVVVPLPPSTS